MNKEQQLACDAFRQFAELAKGMKLPCQFSPARDINVDEFMYMMSVGTNHSFKHRDTRNYVDIINGVLAIRPVPGKLVAFFDTIPFNETDFEERTAYAESVKKLDKMPVEVCVEVRFQTSITVDAPAIDGKCQFDSADKVAKWAIKDKFYYLGQVEVVVTDHNH